MILYSVYVLLIFFSITAFGENIGETLSGASVGDSWLSVGARYGSLNLTAMPAVLFVVPQLKTRCETIGAGLIAGLIAGPIAVIPGVLLFLSLLSFYPEIRSEAVPVAFLMSKLGIAWLEIMFQIVILGTFVETGAGLLHSVNERLATNFKSRGREMPQYARPVAAGVILAISIYVASAIGIVDLISKGYSFIALAFIAVLIAPIATVGAWKIFRSWK